MAEVMNSLGMEQSHAHLVPPALHNKVGTKQAVGSFMISILLKRECDCTAADQLCAYQSTD